MAKINFYVLIFLIVSLKHTYGQYSKVQWYHQEDGLPNDLVKSFEVDSLGFVWIATDDGVVKFEGRNFKNLATPSMFSNNFKKILNTKRYGMLTTADAGLMQIAESYNGIGSDFFKKVHNIDGFPQLTYPKSMFEGRDSALWLADLHKVYKIHSEKVETFNFPEKNHTDHFSRSYQFFYVNDSLFYTLSQRGHLYKFNTHKNKFEQIAWPGQATNIYCVQPINTHQILIGSDNGIWNLNFNEQSQFQSAEILPFNYNVSAIKKLNNKAFVIGTWTQGAYILHINETNYSFEFIEASKNQAINDIAIDNQQQLWLATDMGVMLFKHAVFSTAFKSSGYIQDIRFDKNGNYYFSDGEKVYYVQDNEQVSTFYTCNNGLVIALEIGLDGLWMGTNNGRLLFKRFDGKTKLTDFSQQGDGIYSLEIDKEQNLWLIQSRNSYEALVQIDNSGNINELTPKLKSNERVRSLKLTHDGELYIGASSNENYLFKYNYDNRKIESVGVPVDVGSGKLMAVNDLIKLPSKHLLLATKFGLWELSNSGIQQLDLKDMSNELVSALIMDDDGIVWIANSNGIVKYKPNGLTVYDNTDGLPAKTINYRCLKISSNGELIAGTISGLARGNVNVAEKKTPKPIISLFENSGVKTPLSQTRFVQKSLLHFAFATPVYPAKYVHYQYALCKNNNEPQWVNFNGFHDYVIFQELTGGKYKLKVRAKSKGHFLWSEPVEFEFKIFKIWYNRAEVLALIYLVVFALIYVYTRYTNAKNKREKEKLETIIEHKTIDLREQNEELKNLNAHLKQAKNQAEDAVKTKDKFFSILAHDLKSPFNTIIGFSEMLLHNRNEMTDELLQQMHVEMLKTSENTYKLLQNLLDWAMAQSGTMKINKEQIVLNDLVHDIIPVLKSTGDQKSVELLFDVEETLEVYADAFLLGTIVRNLISNALKYSYANSKVEIKAFQVKHMAVLKIIDSGVGIPQNMQEKLFSISENVSTPGTANEAGTGLGLILCAEFVQMLNGTIELESEPNKGSTFTVQLPVKATK